MAVRYYDPNGYFANMPPNLTNTEAIEIAAGDTVKWSKVFSRYPASAGWALSYSLRNAQQSIEISGSVITPNGDAFDVLIPATDTAPWVDGYYDYQAYVTNVSGERYTVEVGRIRVLQNLAVLQNVDNRTHNQKMLDAITAVLENRATGDVDEYSIDNVHLKKIPVKDLEAWRARYAYRVRVDRLRDGEVLPSNSVGVAFK